MLSNYYTIWTKISYRHLLLLGNGRKLTEFPLEFLYAHKIIMRFLFLSAPHKNCLWIYYGNSWRSAKRWVKTSANVWFHDAESYKLPDISALLRIAVGSSVVTARKFGVSDVLLSASGTSMVTQANLIQTAQLPANWQFSVHFSQ